jgi:Glycosyl hydrolase family 12
VPPTPAPIASPPTPTGQTNCTTNQNGGANNNVTQLDSDTYHLQANEYNSGADFTICTDGNPEFTISSSGVNVSHDGAPGAYPSIYKGCHWGYCTQNSGLPVSVSTMASTPNKVTTSYTTMTVNNGAWDDSYDIWFNPAQSTNDNSSGLEMMIWLSHFGGTQPAGSPGPTVTIDGISFTVWYGGSGNGGTVSFVANNSMSSVSNLDLGPLAAYAVSRGYMQNSWNLIDVEAGFEPWTSGQGLTADAFNVTVN